MLQLPPVLLFLHQSKSQFFWVGDQSRQHVRHLLVFLLTIYPGYCKIPVLHVEFHRATLPVRAQLMYTKILMVFFQMESNMFEHDFQDLE